MKGYISLEMPINEPKYALASAQPETLPSGPAIYVLWRDHLPIHAGFVTKYTQSLAERVRMHMPTPGDDPTPGGPTHFSYLLTDNPVKRLGEIMPLLEAAQKAAGSKP